VRIPLTGAAERPPYPQRSETPRGRGSVPGEVGVEDVERLLAVRKLGGHRVPDSLADESAGQRRQHGDAAFGRLRLIGAHDLITVLLARFVLELDGRAEGPPLPLRGRIDHLGVADLGLELVDAALDEPLPLTRGVVFRVLAQIAVGASLGDGFADGRSLGRLETLELVPELLEAGPRHGRSLDGHVRLSLAGPAVSCREARSWPGRARGPARPPMPAPASGSAPRARACRAPCPIR